MRASVGAAARGVVALEGQEDDEPRQQREAGGEDAEHPGSAVAVREIAPVRRAASYEEHRRDRDGRDGDDDHRGRDDAHRPPTVPARTRAEAAQRAAQRPQPACDLKSGASRRR
jgi:hypothetical protein